MPRIDDFKNTLMIAREVFQRKDPEYHGPGQRGRLSIGTNRSRPGSALYQSGDQDHLA